MRKASGALLTAGILLLLALPRVADAQSGYPPGGYPGPAPENAFPTVAVSRTLDAHGGVLSAAEHGAKIVVVIPPGAFSAPTQVTVYAGAASVVGPLLPTGQSLLLAYGIAWTPSGDAAQPLGLTVSDAVIPGGAAVYETTGSGVEAATGAEVRTGSVTVSFATEAAIVVAEPATLATPSSKASSGRSGLSVGAEPATIGFALIAAILVVGIGGALAWWLRRRSGGHRGP